MRVAVIGRQGQVARALAAIKDPRISAMATFGRPDFDLAALPLDLLALEAFHPDIIVNAAAYTAVDKAESEEKDAYLLNADGPAALAAWAASKAIGFFHLSTDYVFPGDAPKPYQEDDPVGPLSVYGKSKLEGETRILEAHPFSFIFRTAWVYDAEGQNFVKTMLRLAPSRPELTIVSDQFGAPTFAADIAEALIEIAARMYKSPGAAEPGIYHLSGGGDTSWAGFAAAIFAEARKHGLPYSRIKPILTKDYPTPAKRPHNSRLDCRKLETSFGLSLPHWSQSLARCMAAIAKTTKAS
jgi:dTDP-4-dehydrorhamnose reductase